MSRRDKYVSKNYLWGDAMLFYTTLQPLCIHPTENEQRLLFLRTRIVEDRLGFGGSPCETVAKLRERGNAPVDENEPTRVITVRLPKSLHESLRTEAHEKRTSMNKLCISKLLQMIDDELIPGD